MNPWLRARHFLRPVHRTPADWRDAWIHHGFRVFLVLLIALAIPWLFPRTSLPEIEGLAEGSIADRDVIAEIPFSVSKPPSQLASEQAAAADAAPTIITKNPAVADSAIARARRLFAAVDSAATILERRAAAEADPEYPEDAREIVLSGIADVVSEHGMPLPTDDQLRVLASEGARDRVETALVEAFDGLLRRGAIHESDLPRVQSRNVLLRERGGDQFQRADTLATMEDFYAEAADPVLEELPAGAGTLFNALAVLFAQPTLVVDAEATRQAREQARQAVEVASGYVFEGERIVARYELIGAQEAQRLRAYQEELVRQGLAGEGTGFWRSLGMILLGAGLLGIVLFTTYQFRREIYEDLRCFSVLLVLIVIVIAVSGIIAGTAAPAALIPVAFASLLVAALFDAFLATVVVGAIAGLLLAQAQFEGLTVPVLTAAAGVTAAFAVGEVRRRSQSWMLIATITGSYAVTGLCLLLIGKMDAGDLLVAVTAGFGNATVCTALAMGAVLPALESFTRRTTEQTLLELADMNRPLLRRLAREAPGTYAHSINMANLVEAACSAIGADSVLARVGVYYHDIGKLNRPQYFIENQPRGLNPHDRLSPIQSAEILRAHVREGIEMADEARLPEVVKDFIREHHGTQRIEFFFHKAQQEDPDGVVDPNDFCYPGPKPQTKETATAMLADAVEAASRTLSDPSPERIRSLIKKLADARMEQGQFDECGLTFRELDQVKSEFARVLTGLYHHRIDYPTGAPALPASREGGDGSAGTPGGGETGDPPALPAGSGPPDTDASEPPETRPTDARPSEDRPSESAQTRTGDAPHPGPRPRDRDAGEVTVPMFEDPQEQMSIDLERAAQSDTGPPPDLESEADDERADDTIPFPPRRRD